MILRIFDFFRGHALARRFGLLVITLALLVPLMRLSYKEDIQDFLPLSTADRERMAVYQDISGMNRLYVVFASPKDHQPPSEGVEQTVRAIECFAGAVQERDTAGWCRDLQTTFDVESLAEAVDFVYANIPLFLTQKDYNRMDSLLCIPGFMDNKLQDDLNALMFPTGSFLSQSIASDPLGLFAPALEALQQKGQHFRMEMYDGYIFTPDMSRAIVMLSSPFGSSESESNAQLVALLDGAIERMNEDFPEIKASVIGGPQIAVGNARQIRHDSILAIALAASLILALLLYAFRRFRDILLIALSVGWGWLFALGGMALVHDSISLIVIGISSVIIGIAVNYPLHLISHTQHQPDIRQALREITTPLLVGNITTVGAFLALVPLKSLALRDLGLFASFLLLGTILFVLVWLPFFLKKQTNCQIGKCPDLLDRLASLQIDRKRWIACLVAVLTLVFGYFSLTAGFDTDISNINYMTAEQKEDMTYFGNLFGGDNSADKVTLYLPSSASDFDGALACSESKQATIDSLMSVGLIVNHQGVSRFLPSKAVQAERIARWNEWLGEHPGLLSDLNAVGTKYGFAANAFSDFAAIIGTEHTVHSFDYFLDALAPRRRCSAGTLPLTSQFFAGNVSLAGQEGHPVIAEMLTVRKEDAERVKTHLPDAFDIASIHSAMADALSDDFNYVGWACSLIVFFFLWISFRRIELAVISFIPMLVSWIWILGIMSILGIKFNIVNIILATFIFGQGDDYTIFMTEGCISEYIHGRPVLVSYKRSIILSALIMFIGIGSLIFARHPALHSLAEITIIGMFSVVLMAYLIPPLLFKWLMRHFPKRFEGI